MNAEFIDHARLIKVIALRFIDLGEKIRAMKPDSNALIIPATQLKPKSTSLIM
jgi:hypothetical protein